MTDRTKACPYCAEEILSAAIKCKHCGEFLDKDSESGPTIKGPNRVAGGRQCARCEDSFSSIDELARHLRSAHDLGSWRSDAEARGEIPPEPSMPATLSKKAAARPTPPKRSSGSPRATSIICPHCQTKGGVVTRQVKRKRGISGSKATGAVLTAGLSVLATGLSRKDIVTAASCSNCGVSWDIG